MRSAELLYSLKSDIEAVIEAVRYEFLPLPAARLNLKESADSWSILECLDHLNRYSLYYNAEISTVVAQASKGAYGEFEFKSTWLGRKFIRMMHPDNQKRLKTFNRMNPNGQALSSAVLDKFMHNQRELLKLIQDASAVNISRGKIGVEFMRLIKINIGDALQFVVVHEIRHIEQARNVKLKTEQMR